MADGVSHVLRIPRSDEEGFVLVRVSSAGHAAKPLDARIVATEGEAPYVLSLRHDRIDKLRSDNAPCTPDEWESILLFLLLGQGNVANIDATATVQEESALAITIRKRVQNITQRLGVLSLAYDGDEGIELFAWCGEAVEERTQAEQGLAAAAAKQTTLQATVDDLKAQLEDFIATKDADEAVMLEKFCTLLNEKKLKIRILQRQLASAAEDGQHAAAVAEIKKEEEEDSDEPPAEAAPKPAGRGGRGGRGSRGGRGGRLGKIGGDSKPTKRGAKRTATAAAVSEPDEEDSDDEDEFEKPATRSSTRGKGKGKEKAPAAAAAASADDEPETESEADDRTTDNDDVSTQSEGNGGPDPMDEDNDNTVAEAAPVPEEVSAPPPRRVLAFGKPRSAASGGGSSSAAAAAAAAPPPARPAPKTAQPAADSDTDSDDEL